MIYLNSSFIAFESYNLIQNYNSQFKI